MLLFMHSFHFHSLTIKTLNIKNYMLNSTMQTLFTFQLQTNEEKKKHTKIYEKSIWSVCYTLQLQLNYIIYCTKIKTEIEKEKWM